MSISSTNLKDIFESIYVPISIFNIVCSIMGAVISIVAIYRLDDEQFKCNCDKLFVWYITYFICLFIHGWIGVLLGKHDNKCNSHRYSFEAIMYYLSQSIFPIMMMMTSSRIQYNQTSWRKVGCFAAISISLDFISVVITLIISNNYPNAHQPDCDPEINVYYIVLLVIDAIVILSTICLCLRSCVNSTCGPTKAELKHSRLKLGMNICVTLSLVVASLSPIFNVFVTAYMKEADEIIYQASAAILGISAMFMVLHLLVLDIIKARYARIRNN